MKQILLIALISLFSIGNAKAQLADGSVAPDWTLIDLNGTSHNLYTYLDSGYTVFIDFSATWCGPCWGYHISGALENLYVDHGPAGMPNVSPTTTDDVMVFFIEGDGNTIAELNGNGSSTYGDWVTGVNDSEPASGLTPYPIICTDGTANNTAVTQAYSIGYWPTIYMICPDRVTKEIGQSSNPYAFVAACPSPASFSDDIRTFSYTGETLTCEGSLTPEIKLQNYGLNPLTSATIEMFVNGVSDTVIQWTGNLATYATDNVILSSLSGLIGNEVITIEITSPNGGVDADPSNNQTISFAVVMATQNTSTNVTVAITTDRYGEETTWEIKTSSGLTVASGGPWTQLSANGTTIQTPVTTSLSANECHTFTIYDSYGDGINAGFGAGSYLVSDGNGLTLAAGGQFADEESAQFKTDALSSITENSIVNSISIYPNPVNDIATLAFYTTTKSNATVNISNTLGEVIYSKDIGSLISGQHILPISTSGILEGMYFVNLITNNNIITKKITIVR